MNKNTISKVLMATALGGLAVVGGSLFEQQTAQAQNATSGSLRGTIRDKAGGESAVGATVVATSPALQGEQVVITDDSGQYFITSLPPGAYTLTVYYNDATFSRGNVIIQVGKEAVVNVTVDTGAATGKPKGEVINIQGSAPIVDQGSTKTGVTITEDYTRNIPSARTFGGVVGQAAGAQADAFGTSFSGATSLENVFIVEGVNTTDVFKGGISSNLPNEFISETEVITGGYNAEFGRATGGVVNVVTKSGGNEFHGSVFGYLKPGALVSSAKAIQREGSSIDQKTDLDYQWDGGAELGGPIVKDKLWFHLGINPQQFSQTTQRIVQTQVDANNDGVPDVDPDTGFVQHEEVSHSDVPTKYTRYYFTGKLSGAINQNNQFQVSAFGSPRRGDYQFTSLTRAPSYSQFHDEDGAYDVSGKWTSKFNDGKTQVDAVIGYHKGYERQDPLNASQDVPVVRYNFARSLYDFSDLEGASIGACQDNTPSDPYPGIVNCPVVRYAEQGIGYLESHGNSRTAATLALTQRVKAAGVHVFKVGGDFELATTDFKRGYTGGQFWSRSANTSTGAPGRWTRTEFDKVVRTLMPGEDPNLMTGEVACVNGNAVCSTTRFAEADVSNRNFAAYVQDSWNVRPNLTLDLGLRWERQIGYVANGLAGTTSPEGLVIPDKGYELPNLLAPRLGFIFDPTKEGKSKIFGHWGRFFENVPMDLNARSFGGEITNQQVYNQNRFTTSSGSYDPNCNVDHGTADPVGTLKQCGDLGTPVLLGGGSGFVAPSLRGQYTDELVLGTEYEIMADIKFGLNYVHRNMPRVIEDMYWAPTGEYTIVNPGEDFHSDAEALRQKAMQTTDPTLAQLYTDHADQLDYAKRFARPIRNYDGIQLTATQRPTKSSLILASYTFSQSRGNYPGLFSTETLQDDPNITSLYDLPELMANRYGPMGLDRPHNLKFDGFYMFDFKKAGGLTTGVSLRAQSGIPHNALAAHPFYGVDESYVLPRGALQRSPVTTNVDIHLAYGYRINKTTQLEGFIRIFNLFNTQDDLDRDETYTFDNALPIVNGTPADLKHLKAVDENGNETNTTPTPNKNFGHTNSLTAPRSMQLGFRLTF